MIEDGESTDLTARLKTVNCAAKLLRNRRTAGLSGALNTGLDQLARKSARPDQVFVAFLDDDDAWTPDHLAVIEAQIREGAHLVATPFLRLEPGRPSRRIDPPSALCTDDFMEQNPGIQGASFAARLDVLLEAGGFNEALPSCTDRDLWIRLSRRRTLVYATTSTPSMHHYACSDRPRLSSRGSTAKLAGLDMFEHIHGPLMPHGRRGGYLSRSLDLFGWRPAAEPDRINGADRACAAGSSAPVTETETEIPPLIVGIIADDRRVETLERLLDDLAARVEAERLAPPDVLLLENRPETSSGDAFARMVACKRADLRIRVIDRAAIDRLVARREWQAQGADTGGRMAIADARTLLQACLYHLALERPGCAVWIVDDDMRLDPIVAEPTGLRRRPLELGRALRRMRATGADICIGSYTDAPPLPAIASIRGQLVDLVWNLRRLSACDPEAPVPPASRHNAALRAWRRDYYHDLSKIETDRQETPFALEPSSPEERCGDALVRLVKMFPRILAGEAPLRPLAMEADDLDAFRVTEAVHRGGNTFVFSTDALSDLPNLSPTVAGRPTRRSDMIWALLQRQRLGRRVVSVPVGLRHDRTGLPVPEALDPAGIADDLCGYAMFNALAEGGEDIACAERLYGEYQEERLAALRLSFHRIRGLALELKNWLACDAPRAVMRLGLEDQADRLLGMFSSETLEMIENFVRSLGKVEIRRFLSDLEARIERHAESVRTSREIPRLLAEERARAVCAAISAGSALDVLGKGAEGVVLTDGKTVWKCFDRWTPEQAERAVPILRALIADNTGYAALRRPVAMVPTPLGWVLSLPYEESGPWPGGHGPGLVELIADLHRAGLVCRNLHPKNLRVAEGTVRLVDYGADLRRLSDTGGESQEFARMCRRAWLCWRWWWRDDLDLLMRRSLHEADLPELDGHENLIRAVRERLGLHRAEDPTLSRALELRPARALDYGAGKGKQAGILARAGAEVVAWDPDPAVAPRLQELASLGVRRAETAAHAVASGPFDLVICRRVACLLDEPELTVVLDDIRTSLAHGGRALFALCHPAYAHRACVAEATPCTTPGDRPAALWTKTVRATGRILCERHRSERQLRRLLMRAGLRIVARHERQCIEFERFEIVSDLLVYELVAAAKPQVSLLVKACAMDAESLEIQLHDVLAALEGPATFRETVLALDTRQSGFPRPHAPADLPALRTAAKRLLEQGLIDQIVETPSSAEALRALNDRWFDLDLPARHSAGGAATAALLAGFEACSSAWVLHADIDMMIARRDHDVDPVADMLAAMQAAPSALTASFPIAHATPRRWGARGPQGPWRVESRIALVNLDRIRAILPLPNRDRDGTPELSWHRAMDEAVRLGHGASLRGGRGAAFCIHPPNSRKEDLDAWEEVRSCVARNRVPERQLGLIEWSGELSDWRQPERHERFVFVICGRNVMPERFRRCWDSVRRQSVKNWGAIVIDDASSPWIADEIAQILAGDAHRVSFLRRRRRGGLLANTVHAIRHLCAERDQIVVTLDADDCLIGHDVLSELAEAYDAGAELTVGSMLRTDKHPHYPVTFDDPRANCGGNVWQHLRSFRKGLFDAIPDADLRLDGRYVDLASDWAFMIPVVEAACSPVWLRRPLYLHEPGELRDPVRAARREEVIARLIAKNCSRRKEVR